MTDTSAESAIWAARTAEGLSREKVVRQLDPPVSVKTLERWERGISPAPLWRIRQLAVVYGVSLSELKEVAA
jgi:transcriptional regulator with XRE-family HTH domain